eukprot:973607-Amphidinium_carterae.1
MTQLLNHCSFMTSVSISRVVHVSRPGLKVSWALNAIETIDGVEYVELSRSDTGLGRFITFNTDVKHVSWPFETLKSLRNSILSGMDAQTSAAEMQLFDKPLSKHARRKLRDREKSKLVEAPYVTVSP